MMLKIFCQTKEVARRPATSTPKPLQADVADGMPLRTSSGTRQYEPTLLSGRSVKRPDPLGPLSSADILLIAKYPRVFYVKPSSKVYLS